MDVFLWAKLKLNLITNDASDLLKTYSSCLDKLDEDVKEDLQLISTTTTDDILVMFTTILRDKHDEWSRTNAKNNGSRNKTSKAPNKKQKTDHYSQRKNESHNALKKTKPTVSSGLMNQVCDGFKCYMLFFKHTGVEPI